MKVKMQKREHRGELDGGRKKTTECFPSTPRGEGWRSRRKVFLHLTPKCNICLAEVELVKCNVCKEEYCVDHVRSWRVMDSGNARMRGLLPSSEIRRHHLRSAGINMPVSQFVARAKDGSIPATEEHKTGEGNIARMTKFYDLVHIGKELKRESDFYKVPRPFAFRWRQPDEEEINKGA